VVGEFFFSFHEDFPERLVQLQQKHWSPLLEWVRSTYSVELSVYEGILNTKQPDATILKLGSVVADYDAFKLAGKSLSFLIELRNSADVMTGGGTAFERSVLASKSYLIALGLVEGFFTVDEAAQAAHVEVQSQIDRWGEVEDSKQTVSFASRLFNRGKKLMWMSGCLQLMM